MFALACRSELPVRRGKGDLADRGVSCLAYTDRDIADHRRRLPVLEAEAHDPMTPRPRRDRAAAKAAQICAVIERHETSRPEATHMEGGRVA